jgi:hypothetical protein
VGLQTEKSRVGGDADGDNSTRATTAKNLNFPILTQAG